MASIHLSAMLTTTGWRISTSAIAIPPLANIALTAVTRYQVIHPLRHSLHAHPRLQRLHPRLQHLHLRLQRLQPAAQAVILPLEAAITMAAVAASVSKIKS